MKQKKEIGKITKDSKNPFFKSNYLSLNGLIDAVEGVLKDHELILMQPIKDNLVNSVIVDITDGSMIESSLSLPNITDPQKLGSAITYYRRYTLQSLLGLQAEDDDGNTATKQVKTERKPALTGEKFEKSKLFTSDQIQQVLDTFRMSDTQRKELKTLL